MSTLFVDGAVVEDSWVTVDGEQPVPDGENVLVSLSLFEEHRNELLTRNDGRLGVFLEAGEPLEAISEYLDKLDLVALDFPSFADGRSFSKARLLRDRYGFEGQIRATGDIRIDQVQHMRRSGFDALLVSHAPTIDGLIEVKDSGLNLFYQPALDPAEHTREVAGKAWARRAI